MMIDFHMVLFQPCEYEGFCSEVHRMLRFNALELPLLTSVPLMQITAAVSRLGIIDDDLISTLTISQQKGRRQREGEEASRHFWW